jgi:hypothetical protein
VERRGRLEKGIPARLSKTEGRKFGVLVGGAFLLITGFLWWRGKHGLVPYVGTLGGALVVAGLLVPTWLGPVYRAWMGLALLLSKVTTPIFMGVIYFLVFTPVAIGMRLIGRRAMVHKEKDGSYWIEREPGKPEPAQMKRQF